MWVSSFERLNSHPHLFTHHTPSDTIIGMESLHCNYSGVRHEQRNGRDYLVAKLRLIVPGTLNGSNGPIYYSPEENGKNVDQWNGMPLVVYHPTMNGRNVSARSPDVAFRAKVGRAYNARIIGQGILESEGWFEVDSLKRVDNRVYDALINRRPIELSTGLYVDREPAPANAIDEKGRSYAYLARNYKADHIAILPDQKGACSLADGCGVVMNSSTDLQWLLLSANASKAGRTIPPKKSGNGDGDDDEFASDEQRRAFFGKLAAGKIEGTKRTTTRKETEDETIERHRKERDKAPSDKQDELSRKQQKEWVDLHPTKSTGSKFKSTDDLSLSRKGDVIDDGWEVKSVTTAGGKTQVHATKDGERKVFTSTRPGKSAVSASKTTIPVSASSPEGSKPKQSLMERMKAKGRTPIAPHTPSSTIAKSDAPSFEDLMKGVGKYKEKSPREGMSQKDWEAHKIGDQLWHEWKEEDQLAKTEKEKNAARHRFESKLHKARIKQTGGGYKFVGNDEGAELEWLPLSNGEVSQSKACVILHDGTVHGKKLTDKQRRFFGARCNGPTDNIEWLSLNAFCATGEGGGVDPSCSSGKKSRGRSKKATTTPAATEDSHATKVKSQEAVVAKISTELAATKARVKELTSSLKTARMDLTTLKSQVVKAVSAKVTASQQKAKDAATKIKELSDQWAARSMEMTSKHWKGEKTVASPIEDMEKQIRSTIGTASAHQILKELGVQTKAKNKDEAVKKIVQKVIGRVGAIERVIA